MIHAHHLRPRQMIVSLLSSRPISLDNDNAGYLFGKLCHQPRSDNLYIIALHYTNQVNPLLFMIVRWARQVLVLQDTDSAFRLIHGDRVLNPRYIDLKITNFFFL